MLNTAWEEHQVPERSTSIVIMLTDGDANTGEGRWLLLAPGLAQGEASPLFLPCPCIVGSCLPLPTLLPGRRPQLLGRCRVQNSAAGSQGCGQHVISLSPPATPAGESRPEKIQENVRNAIGGRFPLYNLGFGHNLNYNFLEKMALENNGLARRIYEDSDANLQLQVHHVAHPPGELSQ